MALALKLGPLFAPGADEEAVGSRTREHEGVRLRLVQRTGTRSVRVGLIVSVVVASLFAVVLLRTQMAQQQLRLDRLNSDIVRARNNFDRLRAERARFQSPAYLNERARAMGMVQGLDTQMLPIPSDIAVLVASGVGKVDSDVKSDRASHLDEFGRMKRTVTAP